MIIIDTPYHVTFSNTSKLPTQVCVGKCKKSWWEHDLKDRGFQKCPQCGGMLDKAVENVHFKVLSKYNRKLKLSDLKKFNSLDPKEESTMRDHLNSGMKIHHLSRVKKKFQEKALEEWC